MEPDCSCASFRRRIGKSLRMVLPIYPWRSNQTIWASRPHPPPMSRLAVPPRWNLLQKDLWKSSFWPRPHFARPLWLRSKERLQIVFYNPYFFLSPTSLSLPRTKLEVYAECSVPVNLKLFRGSGRFDPGVDVRREQLSPIALIIF